MGALQVLDGKQARAYSGAASILAGPASRAAALDGWQRPEPDRETDIVTDPEPDPNFESLMTAVAERRDNGAFAELFGHFGPRVKAFMLKGGASMAAAEELAQETMIQVWRRAGSYDATKASAATWIFTIARNKRIDRLRREGRPGPDPELYEAEQPRPPSPFDSLSATEIQSELEKRVSRLSDDQIQVIEKAFYEDKSHAAIAEDLDLPLGTVKSRIRLALNKLRTMLEEDVR